MDESALPAPGQMCDATVWTDAVTPVRLFPTRRRALVMCAMTAFTALMCGGVLAAAALVPAPPAVLPLVIVVCLGCPMLAAVELSLAIPVLRGRGSKLSRASESHALRELRRHLDRLPETRHPLGL